LRDFYICRNILSPADFDSQWHNLITTYPKAAGYLNSELYSSKERWAKAYTTKFFIAGISSTSRVEGENSVIKNCLQGCPNLCELVAVLDQRLCDETQYINHSEWHYANTSARLSDASTEYFLKLTVFSKSILPKKCSPDKDMKSCNHSIIMPHWKTIIRLMAMTMTNPLKKDTTRNKFT